MSTFCTTSSALFFAPYEFVLNFCLLTGTDTMYFETFYTPIIFFIRPKSFHFVDSLAVLLNVLSCVLGDPLFLPSEAMLAQYDRWPSSAKHIATQSTGHGSLGLSLSDANGLDKTQRGYANSGDKAGEIGKVAFFDHLSSNTQTRYRPKLYTSASPQLRTVPKRHRDCIPVTKCLHLEC